MSTMEMTEPRQRGRAMNEDERKRHILGIRGSALYREWLRRFARFRRKDQVDLIDEALETLARSAGFEAPPKR